MPQPCLTCTHVNRKLIDEEIVKKAPLSLIAKRWNLSKAGIWRHKTHISPKLLQRAGAARDAKRDELECAIDGLLQSARTLHHRAKRKRDSDGTLKIIRELSRLIELKARLTGKLDEGQRNEVHFHISAEKALAIAQTYVQRHDGKRFPN